MPRDKIIYTYVISVPDGEGNKKKNKVTDFLSFYALPSHVMGIPKHNMLYVIPVLVRPAIPSSTSPLRSPTNS